MRKIKWILLLCLLLGGQSGFADEAKQPVDGLAQFGEKLVTAFNAQDVNQVAGFFDFHELAVRSLKTMGKDDSPDFSRGFVQGFEGKGGINFLSKIIELLKSTKGTANFMRVVTRDNDRRVLLRFDLGENGFDYAEYLVQADPKGGYRIIDWYQLSQGQMVSVTLGAVTRLMIDPNPTVLATLFGVTSVDQDVLKQIKALGELDRAGKYKEAIAALDKMPKPIYESRVLMAKRVSLANLANDEQLYRQALARMAALFGNDPSASFLLMDHYFYEGNLDKTLQCISLIESRVGVDGVTEQLRASMYFTKSMYNEGFAHARESIRLEPDRPDMYWLLALNYIHAGQFKNAIATYDILKNRFGYQFGLSNFKGRDGMDAFVASPEFKKWMRGKQ